MDDGTKITGARSLWELLERRAEATPDRTMLIDAEGRTVTFAAFRDRAERVAAGLAARGVVEGTVVSWQLPTRVSTVVLTMALSRLGAVQVPIIHLYREREVGFALRQTGAELFIIPRQWRGIDFPGIAERALEGADPRPEVLVVDGELPEGDPSALPPPADATDDPPLRWIYYTSGSTADPKGVRHTDRSLIAGGMGLVHALELEPTDVGSVAFPFAHIAGPDYLVTVCSVGFPSVIVESFAPAESAALFREHGVTMVGGSTAFYVAYLAEQRKQPDRPILPDLRVMSGGGAAKPPNLHFEVQAEIGGRGIIHGYGMTEVPMVASGAPSDSDEQLAYTDGRPVRDAEVRIVAADGTEAATGDEGEIRVRGPMVFLGYTDPALDVEAFDDAGVLPDR